MNDFITKVFKGMMTSKDQVIIKVEDLEIFAEHLRNKLIGWDFLRTHLTVEQKIEMTMWINAVARSNWYDKAFTHEKKKYYDEFLPMKAEMEITKAPGKKFSDKVHKDFMAKPVLCYFMLSFIKFEPEVRTTGRSDYIKTDEVEQHYRNMMWNER